jgi:hypothetical protein
MFDFINDMPLSIHVDPYHMQFLLFCTPYMTS